MATTGSILAAMKAGIMPAKIPVTTQVITAPAKSFNEIKTSKSKTWVRIRVSKKTRISPIAPPNTHKKALSIKNSVRMVDRLAPMAFFSPIILVLSRTVTNMILATPNMPTIKERIVMAIPPTVKPPKIEVN